MILNPSKVVLFLLFIVLFTNCKNDEACCSSIEDLKGDVEFIKTFGGSLEDDAVSIIKTNSGGFAILGFTQSNDGDVTGKTSNDGDYWLLVFDKDGNKLWDKTYGGSQEDRGQRLIQTRDGGFALIGYSRSDDGDVENNDGFYDYWVLKIDSVGNIQWSNSYGFSGSDAGYSIIELEDGGYFLTGYLDVSASGGEGNDDARPVAQMSNLHGVGEFWGIRIDENGDFIWRRYFGGGNNDRSYDVIETNQGNFLMVGSSESIDFDISNPKGSYDFWVVLIDETGNLIWEKSYGGSSIDLAYKVVATTGDSFLVAGSVRSEDKDVSQPKGNGDFWLIKIDDQGNLLWEKSYGGSEFDAAASVIKTIGDNILLIGTSRSEITNGESDLKVYYLNNEGDIIWERNYGGSDIEFGNDVVQLQDYSIVLTGSTQSNDQDIPENKGSKDVLLIKLK